MIMMVEVGRDLGIQEGFLERYCFRVHFAFAG